MHTEAGKHIRVTVSRVDNDINAVEVPPVAHQFFVGNRDGAQQSIIAGHGLCAVIIGMNDAVMAHPAILWVGMTAFN